MRTFVLASFVTFLASASLPAQTGEAGVYFGFSQFGDENLGEIGISAPPITGETGFKTGAAAANAVERSESKGGTNTALGLWLAYAELLRLSDPTSLNVIVLFTDGQPTALPARWNVRGPGAPKNGSSRNPTCDQTEKTAVVQAMFCSGTP